MRDKDPVRKALGEYDDHVLIVGRPRVSCTPIPTDVHEEVEMMFALAYSESRYDAQRGSMSFVDRSIDLGDMCLHDALAEGVNPMDAVGHVGRSYGQKAKR